MTNQFVIESQLEKLDVINTEILDECGFDRFKYYKAKQTLICHKHGEVTFSCVVTNKSKEYLESLKKCCPECVDQAVKAKEQWDFTQEWKRDYSIACLPDHLKAVRFNEFKTNDDRQNKIIGFLQSYAEKFANGERKTLPNILMVGSTGTGKTMLASCVINDVFAKAFKGRKQASARFIRSSEITQGCWTARQEYGTTEQAFLDTFINKPLLVIDDLGENDTSGNAEWAKRDRERLSEILDNRYQSMPTIITSNMTVDQVEQFLGDRAFDRLQERLVIIRCDWESHRQQNRVVMEL